MFSSKNEICSGTYGIVFKCSSDQLKQSMIDLDCKSELYDDLAVKIKNPFQFLSVDNSVDESFIREIFISHFLNDSNDERVVVSHFSRLTNAFHYTKNKNRSIKYCIYSQYYALTLYEFIMSLDDNVFEKYYESLITYFSYHILAILELFHINGLYHGDLRPPNFLIDMVDYNTDGDKIILSSMDFITRIILDSERKKEHKVKIIDMGVSGFINGESVLDLNETYLGQLYYDQIKYKNVRIYRQLYDICIFRKILTFMKYRDETYYSQYSSSSTEESEDLFYVIENIDLCTSKLTTTDILNLNIFKDYQHKSAIRYELTEYHTIAKSSTVTSQIKSILFEWLKEINVNYKYFEITRILTEEIFNAFTDIESNIPRSKIQLYGMVSLLIATKLTQKYECNVDDLEHMCGNEYNDNEIHETEMYMLSKLNPINIMNNISIKINTDPKIVNTLASKY